MQNSKVSMKDLINQYNEAAIEIFQLFGLKNVYGEIVSQLDSKWNSCKHDVRWLDEQGELYSNEIRTKYDSENFVMFYVNDGSGNYYYQIFDKSLRDESIES